MKPKSALRLLLCIGVLGAGSAFAEQLSIETPGSVATLRRPPRESVASSQSAQGPRLGRLPGEIDRSPGEPVSSKQVGNVYVDLPCDLFDPGKADPSNWMATSTIARVTFDGINYEYGYDPLAQSYDMMVSGYAHSSGVVLQETVGIAAAQLPGVLNESNVLGLEFWFSVRESNLFPQEWVGITALQDAAPPSSSLDLVGMKKLYDDGRGYTGGVYFLDHLAPGPHVLDLGAEAVADLALNTGRGWFGVGFAADGWDLSGSLEELVFWTVAGGGRLPASSRPFFRVYYNAAPQAFALLSPGEGALLTETQPTLSWEPAVDPNGDGLIYTVLLGVTPDLTGGFQLPAAAATQVTIPLPLAAGSYYWQVTAADPGGATGNSPLGSFQIIQTTAASSAVKRGPHLRAHPNPFNPRTILHYELSEPGPVRLTVLDARGRRVATVLQGHRGDGQGEVVWDGRDHAGRPCSSGVYIATLETTEGVARARLALVR